MYKIIGADQKEYGPITAEQIRQWIAEGRLNGQTAAQVEGGTDWNPLSQFPEFAEALGTAPKVTALPPAVGVADPNAFAEQIVARDYELDIGGCIRRGWALLKSDFGTVFGSVAVYVLIQIAVSALGRIPLIGLLISLGNIVITGPMMGGLYYFFLRKIRRQSAEIGDIFAGFRQGFAQLLLGYLVMALITVMLAIPGGVIMGISIFPMVRNHAADAAHIAIAALGLLVILIPVIYLGVSWMFALPLIIDRQMNFWVAMSASRKVVSRHWWMVFGFLMVCGLLNCAGFAVCCIGIFITMPIVFGALMYAYEDVFNPSAAPTA